MKYFRDQENPKNNYSYATFEESIGGKTQFICRQEIYLIVPVINQGIYNLKSFNNGSDIPLYFDRSYYFFKRVTELKEHISIRENHSIRGKFENIFVTQLKGKQQDQFHVELEMGYNGTFFYAATWKVKANEFGVLIPESSNHSLNDKEFFKNEQLLQGDDINFLLNREQIELDQFILTLI